MFNCTQRSWLNFQVHPKFSPPSTPALPGILGGKTSPDRRSPARGHLSCGSYGGGPPALRDDSSCSAALQWQGWLKYGSNMPSSSSSSSSSSSKLTEVTGGSGVRCHLFLPLGFFADRISGWSLVAGRLRRCRVKSLHPSPLKAGGPGT